MFPGVREQDGPQIIEKRTPTKHWCKPVSVIASVAEEMAYSVVSVTPETALSHLKPVNCWVHQKFEDSMVNHVMLSV